MRENMRILDGDAHVVEPPDLFQPWTPPGRSVIDLPPTTPMNLCGDSTLLADQLDNGFDAPAYVRAMDAQGIDAAVLFPSVGLFVPFLPELEPAESAAACAAYNDWASSYCAVDPSRLAAIGLVPRTDLDAAAAEARRAAGLGLVGVLVRPNHLSDAYFDDPVYDPLYEAVADSGIVLGVHEALGVRGPTIGRDRFDDFASRHAVSHPLEQMMAMAALMLGGVLERHPNLRVAFLESGTGWLPYWLHRLDEHREWMRDAECAELALSPTEYFARQCVISCDPEDALAPWVASQIGTDHMLWASDFPHPDAHFPDAVDTFLAEVDVHGGLSDADLQTIFWDTPIAFYELSDRFGASVRT
ncbi:MAG: amidohydrolase family protein [Acidimicrobiia bacterium]